MEICKICGEALGVLTHVHCEKHGITKDEYRERYGVNKVHPYKSITHLKRDEYEMYTIESIARDKTRRISTYSTH